jgi:hypothetical protein
MVSCQMVLRFDEYGDIEIDSNAWEDEAGSYASIDIGGLMLVLDKDQCTRLGQIATDVARRLQGGRYDRVPE